MEEEGVRVEVADEQLLEELRTFHHAGDSHLLAKLLGDRSERSPLIPRAPAILFGTVRSAKLTHFVIKGYYDRTCYAVIALFFIFRIIYFSLTLHDAFEEEHSRRNSTLDIGYDIYFTGTEAERYGMLNHPKSLSSERFVTLNISNLMTLIFALLYFAFRAVDMPRRLIIFIAVLFISIIVAQNLNLWWLVEVNVIVGLPALALYLSRDVSYDIKAEWERLQLARELAEKGRTAMSRALLSDKRNHAFLIGAIQNRVDEMQSQLAQVKKLWEIEGSSIQLVKLVGKGGSGEVWMGLSDVSDRPVAVKMLIGTDSVFASEDIQELDREARFLRTLRHRNIVMFHGVGKMNGRPMLVTEFIERGSLLSILEDTSIDLSLNFRVRFALDTAKGMAYLHGQSPPRIHRDLKSGNLLVTRDWCVKVSDFGTSRSLSDSQRNSFKSTKNSSAQKSRSDAEERLMTKNVGTLLWQAPEVLRGEREYTTQIDVFSFAIVMWEIAHRCLPYSEIKTVWAIRDAVMAGQRPTPVLPHNTELPSQYADIMVASWSHDPASRPSFDDIVTALKALEQGPSFAPQDVDV